MNDKFYYLISSLPTLKFNEAPPFLSDYFLSLCKLWANDHEWRVIEKTKINEPFGEFTLNIVTDNWINFETCLRNKIAEIRSKNQNKEPKRAIREAHDVLNGDLDKKIHDIVKEESVLEAEKKLIQLRWDFLDQLEGKYYFDLGFLVIYYLKLQLLERINMFDREAGAQFLNLFMTNTEQMAQN